MIGKEHTPEMLEAIARINKVSKSKRASKPIWMVWVKKERPNGLENVDLRAVCRTKELATLYLEMVKRDEPDAVSVWLEERDDNHLYAQRDIRYAFRFSDLAGKWDRQDWEK